MQGKPVEEIPLIYIDYLLCRQFGWMPSEIDKQDNRVIETFLEIMRVEQEVADDQMRRDKNSKVKYG